MEKTINEMKDDRFIVSIGGKGSGKSSLLLSFIKQNYHLYDMIFLFLPAFGNETDNKYAFMNDYPNIFIQTGLLTNTFINFVHSACQGTYRVFFGIDDATGYGDIISSSDILRQMITTTRHIKCTIWMCIHASKKILAPAFRSNIDYLFIHHLSNQKLTDDLYDEFFSKKVNKQVFYDMIDRNGVFPLTGIDLIHKDERIDFDVATWKMMSEDLPNPKMISRERLARLPQEIKKYIPHLLREVPTKTQMKKEDEIVQKSFSKEIPRKSKFPRLI